MQERVGLPSAFEDVDIDHLAILIADMLSRLTEHNDKIPLLPDSLTRFHSRSPPAITVLEYLRRIIKFTNVEKSCLLLILFCIDLVCARQPLFTISSLTCHRFIISSITICSKGICDSFCSNSIYAKVGGITISELNLLEREFLQFTEWRLYCTREILQEYYVNLIRAHSTGAYTILAADTSVGACPSDAANPPPSLTTQNADRDPHHDSDSPSVPTAPTMMDPSAASMAMNTDACSEDLGAQTTVDTATPTMQVDRETTELTRPQGASLRSPQLLLSPRVQSALNPDYTVSPGRHLRRAREQRDDGDPDEEERQRRRRRPPDATERESPVDFVM